MRGIELSKEEKMLVIRKLAEKVAVQMIIKNHPIEFEDYVNDEIEKIRNHNGAISS